MLRAVYSSSLVFERQSRFNRTLYADNLNYLAFIILLRFFDSFRRIFDQPNRSAQSHLQLIHVCFKALEDCNHGAN